jgi:hypothetical protein
MTMKILVTEEMASLTALGWKPRVLVYRSLFRASRLAQRVGQGARAPVTATQWEPNVGQFDSAPPHSLHGPIGLPLGIHVLMEKPQLAAAARAAGVVLAVGSGGTCTWPSGSL